MSRLDEIDFSSDPPSAAKRDLPIAEVAQVQEPLALAQVLPEESGSGSPDYVDLPLSPADARSSRPAAPVAQFDKPGDVAPAAPLSARLTAFAADGALVLLLVAAALLAATAGRGRMLESWGLLWTGVFALYLSFFSTVVPLVLFGKTVGMALAGLTARGPSGSAPLTAAESARRWLGTALTLVTLGAPLLATRSDPSAPSPGDRLSGRPLMSETVNSQ